MKKTSYLAMLSAAVLAIAIQGLSLEINPDNPVQMAYIANRTEELRMAREKALEGDDMALKVLIRGFRDLDIRAYTPGIYLEDMYELVESGILRDRLILVLESMIREGLFVLWHFNFEILSKFGKLTT